jgi:Flp pilus assembly protein TadD
MSTSKLLLDQAISHHQHGRLVEAEGLYREILAQSPEDPHVLYLLGLVNYQSGRYESAIDHMQQAIRLKPDFAECHNSLGHALRAIGRLDLALASIREAIQLRPDYAAARANLGVSLAQEGKVLEAVDAYREAIRLNPNDAESYCNLGIALWHLDGLDEAVAVLNQAIQLRPDLADAHSNLGSALRAQGKAQQAIASLREALRLNPGHVDAHWNLALTLLACGEFQQGWREYEWRWKRKEWPPRVFQQPRWDGGPLQGRSILLCSEQGLGDTIQFIRYGAILKHRGARVIVSCQKPLRPLLASCPGIDELCDQSTEPTDFDVWSPLLSVPGLLGTTIDTIPAQRPYLFARPQLAERWRRYLNRFKGFKVGICWQGSRSHGKDYYRSIPLAQFIPLADLEGVQLISLQKGPGADQLREVTKRFSVFDLAYKLDSSSGAFTDTAAVIMNLDLVITIDTAIAHLAGALGAPVWTAIPTIRTDWRWLLDRDDSPWYPTMRLFRQSEVNDWTGVFARMATELMKQMNRSAEAHLQAGWRSGEAHGVSLG